MVLGCASDAYCSPMDTGDCPLAVVDTNPAFGIQLHHPRFLEFIGAPESARLLYHSPTFWIQHMDAEDAVVATVNFQRDAGLMLSNLQILSQCVTSLQWMSTEMLDLVLGHIVFPLQEVAALSSAPRLAQCMSAIGLWCPDGSGCSWAFASIILQCVHELSVLFPGGAGSIRELTVYIFMMAGSHSSVASDRSPAFAIDVLEVLRVEKVRSIPNSGCGRLGCKSVVVRRCAGAAQFSVSEGEVGHFGSA